MSKGLDNFDKQSPSKVINQASKFSKTYSKFYETPISPYKRQDLKQLVEHKKQQVQVAVQQGKFQNQLYRNLQINDQKKRRSISLQLQQRDNQVKKNRQSRDQKHRKQSQKYNKHLGQVYKKFIEQQKQKKQKKDQKAIQLRKKLLQFYAKQAQRKRRADHAQIKVSTCYQSAIAKINDQHLRNQQFAMKSARQLKFELSRNNHRYKIISDKIKTVSLTNQNKKNVYQKFDQILQNKQHHFVQTYCKDLNSSLKAFQYQKKDHQKNQKRLIQFFKKRTQRWSECKKRVDQKNAQVPQKCLNILDKTTKASFRQTVSSFRSSARQWNKTVLKNKSQIKYRDQRRKDQLMSQHNDITLRNTNSFKINQKMESMRIQAKKLANQYL